MIVVGLLLLSMLVHDIEERLLVQDRCLSVVLVVLSKFLNFSSPIIKVSLHDLLFVVNLYLPESATQLRFLIYIL